MNASIPIADTFSTSPGRGPKVNRFSTCNVCCCAIGVVATSEPNVTE
jgi:hypothetical protein